MANKAKTWKMLDPDGNPIEVTNLKQWCKDKGFNYTRIWSMLNSESIMATVSYGYKKNGRSPSEHIALDDIQLVNDDGRKTDKCRNRTHVARQAGISTASLFRLIKEEAETVKGWRVKHDIIDITGEADL